MRMYPCWNKTRGVNIDAVLEHKMFYQIENLRLRVKNCENALIMVVCDYPPQDTERPQSMGRHCAPHHYRTPSTIHGWNQAVNMKCFCR
ncbi:hypothetical protein TNCV_1730971 [Trichonephila clavipes]|nr:hypothetical protein TNCV_1730971 [Trichonephila clavipes]